MIGGVSGSDAAADAVEAAAAAAVAAKGGELAIEEEALAALEVDSRVGRRERECGERFAAEDESEDAAGSGAWLAAAAAVGASDRSRVADGLWKLASFLFFVAQWRGCGLCCRAC